MAKSDDETHSMVKGDVPIAASSTPGDAALKRSRVEVERLRKRVARLESDLAASISDRTTSFVELSNALFEERARIAALCAESADMAAREEALELKYAALQRDSALLRAEATRLAERQRSVEAIAFSKATPELDGSDKTEPSGAAWQVARLLRDFAKRHPRIARFGWRVLRVIWWTANGQLIGRFRERRAQLEASRSRTSDLTASADNAASVSAGAGDILSSEIPASIASDCSLALSEARPKPAKRRSLVVLPKTGHRPMPKFDDTVSDGPLVSVVVTSFNYGRSVARAVDSVLAQTFKNLEVIVVEGGSPDPHSRLTVARLDRPRTRVLMQGGPHRAGANRNYGVSQARGRYICCLDADDALAPTFIEKAVFLLERQNYDVVGCALRMVGDDHGSVSVLDRPDLETLLDANHVLTCSVFRKKYWEISGGYRDVDKSETGHVHEDWAYWIRLAALGARFYNLHQDSLLLYTVHGSSLSRGSNVLPVWQQRQMVRQMNQDVLEPIEDVIAFSRSRRAWVKATPVLAPCLIDVEPERSSDPPTLLLALPFMLLGGAERLLREVVGDLSRRGWRIVIVTSILAPADAGDTTAWFLEHTPEIFKLADGMPPETWEDFLHHLVRSRGVDILWIVGSALAYDALRGLRAARPTMRVVDLLFNTVGHTANNRRRSSLIDANFVENMEVRDWLLARGEAPERIRLIKSGIDTTALAPRARSEALALRIGASVDELIIGFCGRWSEEKNPLGFIAQAKRVDPTLKIRFIMTGTGPMRPQIERAIEEANFPTGKFHLLGEVSDIVDVLGSLDLLVLPSVLDGRPVVVLEALSLGVPVLASRVGALPEVITDGETGWICEAGDDAAFARRIEDAARNTAALAGMRKHARAFSEAHLDASVMLEAYYEGLCALLPGDRRNA